MKVAFFYVFILDQVQIQQHTPFFSLTPANAFERLAQSLPTESMCPRSPCVLLAQWSPRTSQHLDVSSMALFGGQMPKTLQRLFRSSWLHSATLKQLVSQIDLGPCTCLEGSWHVLCQIHCGDLHAPLPTWILPSSGEAFQFVLPLFSIRSRLRFGHLLHNPEGNQRTHSPISLQHMDSGVQACE